MSRSPKDPLRPLSEEEQQMLEHVSRSLSQPAVHVTRAKALLAVARGQNYTQAAIAVGYRVGDTIAELVTRFNKEGLTALQPRHAGGRPKSYAVTETERILAEVRRQPESAADGTATWSLSLLQAALRQAPDGLPRVSTYTIWCVLHEAGYSWQKSRTWCETGTVKRKRKSGVVTVRDRDTVAKKKLIERAHQLGERLGLAGWNEDEAGPYQTLPYPGSRWQPEGKAVQQPHQYIRNGTAKLLTLLHPSTGEVRVKGVTSCPNEVLHPWLKEELTAILKTLPVQQSQLSQQETRVLWESWRQGLKVRVTLPAQLPALRLLLIWDNLAGHLTPALLCWMFDRGILPLQTPLGGSWLNMAESIQRILVRRALDGQHPTSPAQIIDRLQAVAHHWNTHPTPFVWGGKRATRRKRARERRQALGGSGAYTHRPVRIRPTTLAKWQRARQVTH